MALPASDEIHLLLVEETSVYEELLAQYSLLISPDEHSRYESIRAPADRRRFLITRAAIRSALTHFVPEISPGVWQFTRNAHGRPAIANSVFDNGLTFNISHAQGLISIVIARAGELGVDVECIDRVVDAMAVARRYFAPEEVSELLALPEAELRTRFFDLWTLKEAWVKATGTGLAKSLHHASFAVSNDRIEVKIMTDSDEASDRWQFWQLLPSSQHRLAIAYARCGSGPCQRLSMKLLVSKMVPMRSVTTTDLTSFRTS